MTEQTSSPADIQATLDFVVNPYSSACGCMGPQGDEPVCPCAMRNVIRWGGRWVQMRVIGNEGPGKGFLDGIGAGSGQAYCPVADANDARGYLIMLTGFGTSKLTVIKAIREITKLGLTEAKNFVEKSDHKPVAIFADRRARDFANMVKNTIEAAGGSVEFA